MGAFAKYDCAGGAQQDFYVHPRRPAAGVPQIEADHIIELNAASTIDLPQASYTGLCFKQSAPVPQVIRLNLVWHWGTGPDQRHLALQYV